MRVFVCVFLGMARSCFPMRPTSIPLKQYSKIDVTREVLVFSSKNGCLVIIISRYSL